MRNALGPAASLTNGLLRQYFPRDTDLARHSSDDLDAVALAIKTRPRKTLGWRTPAEVLDELLPEMSFGCRNGSTIMLRDVAATASAAATAGAIAVD